MKTIVGTISLIGLLFCAHISLAQEQQQPNIGCVDKDIRLRAEDVKNAFIKKGYEVYRDAMPNMASEQPFAVDVKLEKGHSYEFIFVGCSEARLASMEIFDGNNKQITFRKLKHGAYPDYITYAYTPDATDVYLIVLTQVQKNKTMCGSFTIMEESSTKTPQPENTGYAEPQQVMQQQPVGQVSNSNRYMGNIDGNSTAKAQSEDLNDLPATTAPAAKKNNTSGAAPATKTATNKKAPASAGTTKRETSKAPQNSTAANSNTSSEKKIYSNRYLGDTPVQGTAVKTTTTPRPSSASTQPASKEQPATPSYTNQTSNSNRYVGGTTAPAQQPVAPSYANQTSNSNRYMGNTSAPNQQPNTTPAQKSQKNTQTPHSNRYLGDLNSEN